MLQNIHRRPRGRIFSVVLAVALACICLATSVAAEQGPKGVFGAFAHCPVTHSSCVFASSSSGEFAIADKSIVPMGATDVGIAGLLLLIAATYTQCGPLCRRKSGVFKALISRFLKCTEIKGRQAFENLKNTLLGGSLCEIDLIQLNGRVGGQC